MTRNILPKSEEMQIPLKQQYSYSTPFSSALPAAASATTTTAATTSSVSNYLFANLSSSSANSTVGSGGVASAGSADANSGQFSSYVQIATPQNNSGIGSNKAYLLPRSSQGLVDSSKAATSVSYHDEDTSSSLASTTSSAFGSGIYGSGGHYDNNSSNTTRKPGQDGAKAAAAGKVTGLQTTIHIDFTKRPFSRLRLNQWHTNEEIYNILVQCNQLVELATSSIVADESGPAGKDDLAAASKAQLVGVMSDWLAEDVAQYPVNGAVFIFDRRKVKNFKKDAFTWKRRKTGGANSVREDRMCLKVNGVDCIYGCYSHSSLMPTFHRRCYWLLEKPDIVLVHYLQTPNSETGECLLIASSIISSSGSGSAASANGNNAPSATANVGQEWQLSKEELRAELKAMLWPFYLNQNFIMENLKSNSLLAGHLVAAASASSSLSSPITSSTSGQCDFIDKLTTHLVNLSASNKSGGSIQPSMRINLSGYLNQFTPDIINLLTPSLTYNPSSDRCSDAAAAANGHSDPVQEVAGQPGNYYLMLSTPFVVSSMNASNSSSTGLIKQETLAHQQLPVQPLLVSSSTNQHHHHHHHSQPTDSLTSLMSSPMMSLAGTGAGIESNVNMSEPSQRGEKDRPQEKVQLSIDSCSSSGGEKLMLIGNWIEQAASSSRDEISPNYYLSLDGAIINLKQLNKHVLECYLPPFSFNMNDPFLIHCIDEPSQSNRYVSNTFIHLYENGKPYCEPIPFQIRFPAIQKQPSVVGFDQHHFPHYHHHQQQQQSAQPSQTQATSDGQVPYKHQLFLLERALVFLKYYSSNRFDYDYQVDEKSYGDSLSDDNGDGLEYSSPFERRVCSLIGKLAGQLANRADAANSLSDYESTQSLLNNENEGKTLLHLCSACGLKKLFAALNGLRKVVDSRQESTSPSELISLRLVQNDLKPFQLDKNGDTPLSLACAHGHEAIVLELLKMYELELGQSTVISQSFLVDHLMKCIHQAQSHNYPSIAARLEDFARKYRAGDQQLMSSTNPMLISVQHHNPISISDSRVAVVQELANVTATHIEPLSLEHAVIDDDLLIENLGDLTSFLGDEAGSGCISSIANIIENAANGGLQMTHESAVAQSRNDEDLFIASKSSMPASHHQTDENDADAEDENDDDETLNEHRRLSLNASNIQAHYSRQQSSSKATGGGVGNDLNDLFNPYDHQADSMMGLNSALQSHMQQPASMMMMPAMSGSQGLSVQQASPPGSIMPPVPTPQQQQQQQVVVVDDDQDKKIKTLADNIIAAMPHKIKTNSYNSNNMNAAAAAAGLMDPNGAGVSSSPFFSDHSNLLIKSSNISSVALNSSASTSTSNMNNANSSEFQPQPYNTVNLNTSTNSNQSFNIYRPGLSMLRRNATSFDDSYGSNAAASVMAAAGSSNSNNSTMHRNNGGLGGGSCYSSTRSSLSPTSSLSFQYNELAASNSQNAMTLIHQATSMIDDSPNGGLDDGSACSSTFHIDSPPSTAEFCQYFHAASSSGYYKSAIETGFAQLTLTDDEQRELYEAALVIQNAYRRYIQRKKKKIRLDVDDPASGMMGVVNPNLISGPAGVGVPGGAGQQAAGSHDNTNNNDFSLSRSSSTSLSSLTSNNSFKSSSQANCPVLPTSGLAQQQASQMIQCAVYSVNTPGSSSASSSNKQQMSNSHYDDDEENNSSSSEDHKQYEAACIIQKYYRRYKQYENLHKYTEAAVKIQTRYRAYKSSSLSKGFQYHHRNSLDQHNGYHHYNSIDETSPIENADSLGLSEEERKRMMMNGGGGNGAGGELMKSPPPVQYQQQLSNQKQIARKLINMRQSKPRFSPSSPSSPMSPSISSSSQQMNPASVGASVNGAGAPANSIVMVSPSSSSLAPSNNSQLHHFHHHHHHFHHHFHKKNKSDKLTPASAVASAQAPPLPPPSSSAASSAAQILDSSQSIAAFSRPVFRRKLSDIQAPTFITATTTNQLINNCINMINNPATSNVGGTGSGYFEPSNMAAAGASTMSNPGTNANSSFDSESNFDANASNPAKFMNQSFAPALQQFQTQTTNLMLAGDSFSTGNNSSSMAFTSGNQVMNHLNENNGPMSVPQQSVTNSESIHVKNKVSKQQMKQNANASPANVQQQYQTGTGLVANPVAASQNYLVIQQANPMSLGAQGSSNFINSFGLQNPVQAMGSAGGMIGQSSLLMSNNDHLVSRHPPPQQQQHLSNGGTILSQNSFWSIDESSSSPNDGSPLSLGKTVELGAGANDIVLTSIHQPPTSSSMLNMNWRSTDDEMRETHENLMS